MQSPPNANKPVVEAVFEETLLYHENQQRRRQKEQAALPSVSGPLASQKYAPSVEAATQKQNPLLSVDERIQQIHAQEKTASFLAGLATGGILVGGVWFVRWILTKPEILEKAAEAAI